MTWDKRQIEKKLISLNQKMSNVHTEPLYSTLKADCYVLLSVLKQIDMEYYKKVAVKISLGKLDFSEYYEDFLKESFELLLQFKDKLYTLARAVDNYSYNHPRIALKRRIPEEKYLEMVREFLAMIDKDHYELFESIVDGNLHFAANRQEVKGIKGRCFSTITTEETYIITDYRRKDAVATLPHEIGHGVEMNWLTDFKRNMSWYYSSFVECYPRFLEFAFLDYYKDSEYGDVFLSYKRNLFDALKISAEYFMSFIAHMSDYDIHKYSLYSNVGERVSKKQIDFIIADFFAIYMFNLYKKDKNQLLTFLNKFHSHKGLSDKSIWELVSIDELLSAFYEESRTYNKEANLSRKRKKTSTSQYF